MDEINKEIQLKKLYLIPSAEEIIVSKGKDLFFEYAEETIGWYFNLEEAISALETYVETNSNVFAYEIIGPEYGFGKSQLIFENEASDESPEFQFTYNSNKKLISTYFFNTENPGGERVTGEHIFSKGEKAYIKLPIYQGENKHLLLIPVVIEGKVNTDYLHGKLENILIERDNIYNSNTQTSEPSEKRIMSKINYLLNVEKDSLIFTPLLTVKCNWGKEPNKPLDDCPRIDVLPYNLLNDLNQ